MGYAGVAAHLSAHVNFSSLLGSGHVSVPTQLCNCVGALQGVQERGQAEAFVKAALAAKSERVDPAAQAKENFSLKAMVALLLSNGRCSAGMAASYAQRPLIRVQ